MKLVNLLVDIVIWAFVLAFLGLIIQTALS